MTSAQQKVNGHNGRNGHRGQFARDLEVLLDDLSAAEALRTGALRQIGAMRREVYGRAAQHGVSARMLKAAHALRQTGRKEVRS
jgi:hypothetical protein